MNRNTISSVSTTQENLFFYRFEMNNLLLHKSNSLFCVMFLNGALVIRFHTRFNLVQNLMKNRVTTEYTVLPAQQKMLSSAYFCIIKMSVDSVMIHLAQIKS